MVSMKLGRREENGQDHPCHLEDGLGHVEGDLGHLGDLEGEGRGPANEGERKAANWNEGQSHLERRLEGENGFEGEGGIDRSRRRRISQDNSERETIQQKHERETGQVEAGSDLGVEVQFSHLRDSSDENGELGKDLKKFRLDNCTSDEMEGSISREPRGGDHGNIAWLCTETPCNSSKARTEHFHENGLSEEVQSNREFGQKVNRRGDESWPELVGEHLV